MKKSIVFLVCCCFWAASFAQPKEEASAQSPQQLYDNALSFAHCTPQRKALLEQADALQADLPFDIFYFSIKAALATELDCGTNDTAATDAVIALAEAKLGSNKSILANTLIKITEQTKHYAPLQALRYADAALIFLESPSEAYFYFLIDEVVPLLYALETEASMGEYLEKAKTAIETSKTETQHLFTLYYTLKIYYHDALQELEQTIITAKQALAENEKYQVLKNHQVLDIYVRTASAYAYLGNESESEKWLTQYAKSTSPDTLNYYDAYTYYHQLAVMKGELKKFEQATIYFEQALAQITPHAALHQEDMKLLYNNLAQLYFYQKNNKATKKYIDKLFEYGYDETYSTIYNEVLRLLGNYEEGLKHTERALRASVKDFSPTSIYDNPEPEAQTKNSERVAVLLSQKLVFLCELGIQNKDADLLKKAILTGERALNFAQKKNFGGLYETGKYRYKRYLYQPIIDWLLYAAVRWYELSPTPENLTQIFNYMEKAQSRLLAQALAPQQLPEAIILQKNNLMAEIQDLQQKAVFSPRPNLLRLTKHNCIILIRS
jgi:tetratricopeptide (TPR) repeat protein